MNGRDDRKREIGRFSEHWTMQQTIIGLVHDSEEEHFVKMAYVFFLGSERRMQKWAFF
jgi:hypothetical protein